MNQIEIYLEKFKDFGLKENQNKQKIIDIIKKEININLNESDINIQNGILRINVSGAPKAEIFIKKQIIKESLEQEFNIL